MDKIESKFVSSRGFSFSKFRKYGLAVLSVGIITLIILVIVLVFVFLRSARNKAPSLFWSAVFLSNGRSYFGKIVKEDAGFITLDDVYYLQVKQVPSSVEGEEFQYQPFLMRIGDEIHGPENFMKINKDHILFIEKLKASSSVVVSIEKEEQKTNQ